MRYVWWSSFGAYLGGWLSALLAGYAILVPASHLLEQPFGTGVVALAHHAHNVVLMGLLVGGASGLCLARYFSFRPRKKVNPVALLLAAMAITLSPPGFGIFSGSVAGLQITENGVDIVTMDILPPGENPMVPVGQTDFACGPRGGCEYRSYQDQGIVVSLCAAYRLFPWR